MGRDILAIDVGTTALKIGVFDTSLEKKVSASRQFEINLYDQGKADIEPDKWWSALQSACAEMKDYLGSVGIISLSVTTPGLLAMDASGTPLTPAILFMDGRSRKQAAEVRQKVTEERFLQDGCNLPVSGGSSLASILWIREEQPDIWQKTVKFGHTNTYIVKRLTGEWTIDPSTVSITGLYNTARNDLSWNQDVLQIAELPEDKLPPLRHSHAAAGQIRPAIARELALPADCEVLCGGNDAVMSSLSGGLIHPGDINIVNGTCDIMFVCIDTPVRSPNFNIRCHVIPGLWTTFFVLNTGGIALEWFRSTFCQDMTPNQFYERFIPSVLEEFFCQPDLDRAEQDLPEFVPYLQGSRYSLERLTASFSGLTLETNREQMLLALLKGNTTYIGGHLKEVASMVKLGRKAMVTGGGASIRGMDQVKQRWIGDFDYEYREQSSVVGAAMLGRFYQIGSYW